MMFKSVLCLLFCLLTLAANTSCSGGEVVQLAAAYEVKLESGEERQQLLRVMEHEAETFGFHVDHASEAELRDRPEWAQATFSAAVWRGTFDSENIASASDAAERLGRVWIIFPVGEKPEESERFRISLMRRVRELWPEAMELPIKGGTTIPLPRDLRVDGDQYVYDPSPSGAAEEPNAPSASPSPSS